MGIGMTASGPYAAPSELPHCCRNVVIDLVGCLEATVWSPAGPDSSLEHTLEASARAALYRWLAHCRHHRRAIAPGPRASERERCGCSASSEPQPVGDLSVSF